MPLFTIKMAKGGGVEVIDHELNKTYKIDNDRQESAFSIFRQTQHDKNGKNLNINDQDVWIQEKSITFDISVPHFLQETRDRLEQVPSDTTTTGGKLRRRSIPKSSRKFKKSSKRVFRKKSRATRRR